MQLNIIISLLLIAIGSFAQIGKQCSIPIYRNGDTSVAYKWNIPREEKLGLPHLIHSSDTFHARIWFPGQAIDIWTTDYKVFNGQITNYTDTDEPYDMKRQRSKPPTTFSNKVLLDTALSRKAFVLIQTVDKIPTEDSITGWSMGTDGISYMIETSTPATYVFKDYWTPIAQDSSVIEAKQIQFFVVSLSGLLKLDDEYNKFFATLAPGAYTNDGFLVTLKPSARQTKKFKRCEKRHSHKDS